MILKKTLDRRKELLEELSAVEEQIKRLKRIKVGVIVIAFLPSRSGATTFMERPVKIVYVDDTHYIVEPLKDDAPWEKGDKSIVAVGEGWNFKEAPKEIIKAYLKQKI